MTNLSVRLRELRGASSQAEMARSIGIPQQAWARYEKGIVAPNAETLFQICRVHACSADWLLGLPERGTSVRADKGSMAVNISNNRLDGSIGPFSLTSDPPPSCKKCPHLKKLKEIQKMIAK